MNINKVPSIEKAEIILKEAEKLNPGPWAQHSRYAAQAAKLIVENCKDLEPQVAYVLGLLHDIGRRFGVTSMRHSIDGYNFAKAKGYDLVAEICLTHSHPLGTMEEAFGKWDCSQEEYNFVENYLKKHEVNDYDRLIQLCDAIALPEGFVLIEKRMMDVALRHGVHQYTVAKWKATFEIKNHFEKLIGKSIYSVLPGVVENTFEMQVYKEIL